MTLPDHNIAESLRGLAVDIASLTPDPANVRAHSERNMDAVKGSLARFGQLKPIVVQKDGLVVRAGNATLAAAKALGWTHIAATIEEMDDVAATAYGIADNRTAELAEWDQEGLAELLEQMPEDLCAVAGYTDEELAALVADVTPPPEIVEDEVPEPPEEPVTKPGDLWALGDHRVLCGDAVPDTWKVDAVVTDPPYGIDWNTDESGSRGGPGYPAIVGDGKPFDPRPFLVDARPSVLWGGNHYASRLPDSPSWLIWDKRPSGYSNDQADCEIAWSNLGGPARMFRHAWSGGGTLAKENGVEQRSLHPTQKPVALLAWCIERTGGALTILDPFLGSGTTLIAAEQLGRTCYGIEIEPRYCDVIVQRWETLTGKKAHREK